MDLKSNYRVTQVTQSLRDNDFIIASYIQRTFKNMKFFYKILLITSLFEGLVCGCIRHAPVATDWIQLSEDSSDDNWRKNDPQKYFLISSDFDGDGKNDICKVMYSKKENAFGVFAFMGNKKTFCLFNTRTDIENYMKWWGITSEDPGEYLTACGKGYWDCDEKIGETPLIKLNTSGIEFFHYEAGGTQLYYWNKERARFDVATMDD